MQRVLARIHRQRFAHTQVRGGGRACSLGLAVERERGGVELKDGRRRPAFPGFEDGLDTLIEPQQARRNASAAATAVASSLVTSRPRASFIGALLI
jgi:hypothetical protein